MRTKIEGFWILFGMGIGMVLFIIGIAMGVIR